MEQSRMANAARGKLPSQVRARGVACPPPHGAPVPTGAECAHPSHWSMQGRLARAHTPAAGHLPARRVCLGVCVDARAAMCVYTH